jgi:hypothetical protein
MKDNKNMGRAVCANDQPVTRVASRYTRFSGVLGFGLAVAVLFWLGGCDRENNTGIGDFNDSDASTASGGTTTSGSGGEGEPSAGSGGEATGGISGADAGGSGKDAGAGGSDAGSGGDDAGIPSDVCPPNIALPAICRLCADGSCGEPVCSGGVFTGEWRCPEDGSPTVDCDCARGAYVPVCGVDGETYDATCGRECVEVQIACNGPCPCTDCVVGGCANQLCVDATGQEPSFSTCEWRPEYACYRTAICERQADGNCGWTMTPELTQCLEEAGAGGTATLRWYQTCGDPVCGIHPDPFDDPEIRNCSTEQVGDPCTIEGDRCDGVANCGVSLICAASDPTMGPGGCPISRARYKKDIAYLSDEQLLEYRDQLMSIPLASYRYKHAEGAGPQLGFIIEDVEPSVAVSGDRVNLYGYLSMAVAAIKVQQIQIASLQREVEQLRSQQVRQSDNLVCMP